jgi:hypothetical protein
MNMSVETKTSSAARSMFRFHSERNRLLAEAHAHRLRFPVRHSRRESLRCRETPVQNAIGSIWSRCVAGLA